ncbi:MAG: VOC family protein [Candidatus Nitrosopolaris sp.]|jgi:lactoylglutathione lyase
MFNRIGAVILLVSDMKKSMEFYKDMLGMELKQQAEDWVEFSKQGTVLALHPTKEKELTKNISMLIGFNVSELETVCSNLEKKKVKFHKKVTNEVFGKHAIIEDPDGHLISLAEMAPKEEFTQIPYYHGFAPE